MKPSDSSERTRERKRKQRMSRPTRTTSGQQSRPVTPQPIIQDLSGDSLSVPTRTKGKTPEESGYPEGQVEVRIGEQGQKLWRLRGHYDLPNNILCFKA